MILTRLKLHDFRGYETLDLSFDEGVTAIVGDNAAGKTNLAEAIQYLSLARSFRTNDEGALLRMGSDSACIEATVKEGTMLRTIRVELLKDGKRIYLNEKPLRKISELSRLVNVISFCPSDVSLFTGSPGERRNFLDMSLSKQSLDYFRLISRYSAILKERNALLKSNRVDDALLEVLTNQLIDLEEPIISYRELYVANLNRILPGVMEKLRGDETPAEISYRPFLKSGPEFKARAQKAYADAKESDLFHKSTGIGTHREDYSLRLRGKDISVYGSQGENRIAVLSLKLCPYFLIEDEEKKPICVLDDVTSELDADKVNNLFAVLKEFRQAFVTTTKLEIDGASYIDVAANKAIRRN